MGSYESGYRPGKTAAMIKHLKADREAVGIIKDLRTFDHCVKKGVKPSQLRLPGELRNGAEIYEVGVDEAKPGTHSHSAFISTAGYRGTGKTAAFAKFQELREFFQDTELDI